MADLKAGLQFKETMAGGFSMDTDEPKQGSNIGKHKGFMLAMHAQVDIDDIDKFITQKTHSARLSGTIDFFPMGMGMKAHSGLFNLFYPTLDDSEPPMKLMIYELGFRHEDQEYYLAGKKEVRDDPGFDLWLDTTTLYTQLHRGTDKSAPVVGAGILTLEVSDLIKLVSTLTVLNSKSDFNKVATIGKFGSFFMGELWDSYCKHV